LGDGAAVVGNDGQLGIVQTGIPFLKVAVFFLVQKARRRDGNQVGGAEPLILRPFFGLSQFGQTQRTPARPEFNQGGFVFFQINAGGAVVRGFQSGQGVRHGRGFGIGDFGRTGTQRKQTAELGAKGKEGTGFHL
jgi:hypothetical protein